MSYGQIPITAPVRKSLKIFLESDYKIDFSEKSNSQATLVSPDGCTSHGARITGYSLVSRTSRFCLS